MPANPGFIAVEAIGAKEIQDKLKRLPPEVADIGIDDGNDYLVKALRIYPTQKAVSRAEAYPHLQAVTPTGKTIIGYSSWKQFKYVMALVGRGETPYKRTQQFRNAWEIIGKGRNSMVVNQTPYGPWLMDNDLQAGGPRAIGWKKMSTVIKERMTGLMRVFNAAVKKAGNKVGLKVK